MILIETKPIHAFNCIDYYLHETHVFLPTTEDSRRHRKIFRSCKMQAIYSSVEIASQTACCLCFFHVWKPLYIECQIGICRVKWFTWHIQTWLIYRMIFLSQSLHRYLPTAPYSTCFDLLLIIIQLHHFIFHASVSVRIIRKLGRSCAFISRLCMN